jgi:hypothetical protein
MDDITLLPQPRSLQPRQGTGPGARAAAGDAPSVLGARLAADFVGTCRGIGLAGELVGLADFTARAGLGLPPGFSRDEGYALRVSESGVLAGADSPRGRFYAAQTLAQLVVGAAARPLPCIDILDWPRMTMRGFTLCYHIVGDEVPLLGPNAETAILAIREMAHLKMNAVVIEPEAQFPYRKHPKIPSRTAFSPDEVAAIRRAAEDTQVEIIPLVQSIGHAYAVLRHPEYAHLRELPDTSQQYCLCNDAVTALYAELAGEVIDAFGATRLHIGGDESRRLGQCPRCREKAARVGIGGLYADHVNRIAEGLLSRGVTPVVWGDIMEDHPDILDALDPRVQVIYWNYDMVDWNRPYVLEMYARPGRTVFTGSAARFGPHGDATFLYKKAMRNIGLLAQETVRMGYAGMIVTDWTKLAPFEVGLVATAYGAEASWSGAGKQDVFCARWSEILFGARMADLDRQLQLTSEITMRRKEILNPHWAPPFVDQTVHFMVDWLDRMDWSQWSFGQVLAQYTQQEQLPRALEQMKRGLAHAQEALAIADEAGPRAARNRRLFDVLRLSALNQQAKCAMGLALVRGSQLLKFPRPDDGEERRRAAAALRAALDGWNRLRAETERVLLPGAFPASLQTALRYKLDPAAAEHMQRFIGLLESGAHLHGLLDGTTWKDR